MKAFTPTRYAIREQIFVRLDKQIPRQVNNCVGATFHVVIGRIYDYVEDGALEMLFDCVRSKL